MVWTEITRRHYRREGLRYESDTTGAEWFVMEPLLAGPSKFATIICCMTGKDRPRPQH
jgi:hypothetical protein